MSRVGDIVRIENNLYGEIFGWSEEPEEYNFKKKVVVEPGLALYLGHSAYYAKLLLHTSQVVWLNFSMIRGINER